MKKGMVFSGEVYPNKFPFGYHMTYNLNFKKHFNSFNQFFYISKNCNYINEDVLTAVFNRQIILTNKLNVKEIKYSLKELNEFN